ncbi:MAG: hypothetical protein WBL95_14950 [Microcoleus sp.]
MICASLGMLNANVSVLHKSLTVEISLSQERVKLLHLNGNILPFAQCDRIRYTIENGFSTSLEIFFRFRVFTAQQV